MRKYLLGLASLLILSPGYAATYPTCTSAIAVNDLGYIHSKIVLCPNGYITASVRPRVDYHSFAIAYNNYCRNIKLTFSTNSANVLINDYQYYKTSGTLPAHKPKGIIQVPDIKTGRNGGIVKITNNSKTSVCIGQQCLYE